MLKDLLPLRASALIGRAGFNWHLGPDWDQGTWFTAFLLLRFGKWIRGWRVDVYYEPKCDTNLRVRLYHNDLHRERSLQSPVRYSETKMELR